MRLWRLDFSRDLLSLKQNLHHVHCSSSKPQLFSENSIERNLISPSIDSLVLLSGELQIDPGHFLSLNRPDSSGRSICRKSQRQHVILPSAKSDAAQFELLVTSTENRRTQPMLAIIEPRSEFSEHFLTHKGDEFILILKGELEVTIDGDNYVLREGDSIYLDSIMPTAWRNSSEMQTQAIWVLSPPSM